MQRAGEVIAGHLSGVGQLVTTFKNTPQAPFENLELHFFGGKTRPLATPAHCGTYTTQASFTPWSAATGRRSAGDAHRPRASTITSGPNGSACPGRVSAVRAVVDGRRDEPQAGAFSPFTLTMTRKDGEQNLQSVKRHCRRACRGSSRTSNCAPNRRPTWDSAPEQPDRRNDRLRRVSAAIRYTVSRRQVLPHRPV